MQSAAVRSTILILALSVTGIPGAFAEAGDVTSTKKREAPAGSGGGHQHYVQSDSANKPGSDGQLAPRLQNLGTHTFPVSTRNRLAQQYINQGLNLAYGFNHAEARRAFREAARLDPGLAMAYWGQALVLGPNINAMMEPNGKHREPDGEQQGIRGGDAGSAPAFSGRPGYRDALCGVGDGSASLGLLDA